MSALPQNDSYIMEFPKPFQILNKEEESKAKEMREKAYQHIKNDDVTSLQNLIEDSKSISLDMKKFIETERWTLESNIFNDRKTNMNLLHVALELNKMKCAEYMLNRFSLNYLLQTYTNVEFQVPPSCKSCLHIIVEQGNADLLKLFMNKIKEIPLISWAMFAKEEKEMFIRKPVVIEFGNEIGVESQKRRATAVHLAVFRGHNHLLKSLNDYDFDMEAEDDFGETPLMWAIWANKPEAFDLLLRFGADVNHLNKFKSSPLHLAVAHDQLKIAEKLIDLKVDLKVEQNCIPRSILENVAAQNQHQLMNILLNPTLRKRIDPKSIKNALFVATKNNFIEMVIEILTADNSLVNVTDNSGNTPVLIAADLNKIELVKIFVEKYNADLTVKNNQLESIYEISIKQPTSEIFNYLIKNLKKDGAVYLHAAAAANDLEKIKFILDNNKADLLDIDNNKNTIFHTAAANNAHDVLEKYLTRADVYTDLQNKEGDTALHLAVRKGHLESFRVLMDKNARIDLHDGSKQNVLHAAISSNREIVEDIVTKINQDTRLLNSQDQHGNTALHLAAKYSKAELIELLSNFKPDVENKNGEIALHSAVRYGTFDEVRAIIELFYRSKKMNIDHQDKSGYSALFISAEIGDARIFKFLVKMGADMTLRNSNGCTLLHKIIEKGKSSSSTKYIEVYHTIVQQSVFWYCQKKSLTKPMKYSTQHYEYQLKAVRYLTSDLYYEGCNALQYAAKLGNGELLKAILGTENVYKFTSESPLRLMKRRHEANQKYGMSNFFQDGAQNKVLYDVTYMVPSTLKVVKGLTIIKTENAENQEAVLSNKSNKKSDVESVSNEKNESGKIGPIFKSIKDAEKEDKQAIWAVSSKPQTKDMISCLEYLAHSSDQDYVNKLLDDEPFKFLISKYWAQSRMGYEIFMWVHLIHMILFTYFVSPAKDYMQPKHNQTEAKAPFIRSHIYFMFFLVWPALILLSEVISGVIFILSLKRHWRKGLFEKSTTDEETSGLMRLPLGIMHFILNNLNHISSVAFCVATNVWFLAACHNYSRNTYLECLAAVLIFGWLHTVNYVKGFKDWNALANILKQIIFKDIIRFAYIYAFILVSFGFAMHVLLQIDSKFSEDYNSPTDTIYSTFYKMLSPDKMLEKNDVIAYEKAGGHYYVLTLVYATYTILSAIVLMNLLIAMMNNTYSEIQCIESTVWRISSLKLALWYERNNFKLPGGHVSHCKYFFDKTENRHMVIVTFDTNIVNSEEKRKTKEKQDLPTSDFPSDRSKKIENQESLDIVEQPVSKIDNISEEIEIIKKDCKSMMDLILEIKEKIDEIQDRCLKPPTISKLGQDINVNKL